MKILFNIPILLMVINVVFLGIGPSFILVYALIILRGVTGVILAVYLYTLYKETKHEYILTVIKLFILIWASIEISFIFFRYPYVIIFSIIIISISTAIFLRSYHNWRKRQQKQAC
ncbi:MAG: hypothetical protein QW806_03780 [Nitrososphaerota archaeon]